MARDKLIFGPVKSRRLGRSLGLELVPKKVCSMDCVYCEVGRTTLLTLERKPYYPWEKIEEAIITASKIQDKFDVFTFTGSGEPTLNSFFEDAVFLAKKLIKKPIALLTNSSLLWMKSVRSAVCEFDIVLPSLDAGTEEAFLKVNQPCKGLKLEAIVEGLKALSKEKKGKVWVEVLLVKGLNDDLENLSAIKKVLNEVSPDKVQLNTVVRPGALSNILPLSYEELKKIAEFFGDKAEVVVDSTSIDRFKRLVEKGISRKKLEEELIAYVKRRPATFEELLSALDAEEKVLSLVIDSLLKENKLQKKLHEDKIYYIVY
ncbi:MAG: radical SAM protein [Thermodesulfobacteria bacterium]|nr:radical SAM protein [Thermodesulfobacteriota bacterium]